METKESNGTNGNGNGNGHKLTAIEIAKPNMARAYEPQNYGEAMQMAKTLAGSSLLGALKTPEAVFMVMATGAELNIPPTAALRSVHIVQGKPVLSADLIVAVCLRSPLCGYFTCKKSTPAEATYETKRRGSGPVENTFSLEDATRAGLSGKDNWKNYGKAMLRHRAAAELARMVYPDLILGIYAEEEMQEVGAPPPIEVPRQQAVIEGEVVEAPNLDRLTVAYSSAKTMDEVSALRADAARLGLDKASDDYKALRQMDKEAVERIRASEAA
jgi:hypothetical protein